MSQDTNRRMQASGIAVTQVATEEEVTIVNHWVTHHHNNQRVADKYRTLQPCRTRKWRRKPTSPKVRSLWKASKLLINYRIVKCAHSSRINRRSFHAVHKSYCPSLFKDTFTRWRRYCNVDCYHTDRTAGLSAHHWRPIGYPNSLLKNRKRDPAIIPSGTRTSRDQLLRPRKTGVEGPVVDSFVDKNECPWEGPLWSDEKGLMTVQMIRGRELKPKFTSMRKAKGINPLYLRIM